MASSPESSTTMDSPTMHNASTDNFKRPSLPNPRTQDVFQSIVKGRKSWKTLRGGEVVWPPELEAALIEGLENYQPDDSRETRLLGRFPMRNRFISDWIYEKTGKRRTAKQVGSRLQQLRDTCGGKRLLNLLSPKRRPCRAPSLSPEFQHKDGHLAYGPPPLHYESESCSDSSGSSPTTPTEAHATLKSLLYRGVEPRVEELPETIVYIDLLPDDFVDDGSLKASWASSTQAAEERSWQERGYNVVRASPDPRHLRDIDPTITLLSRSPTSATSHFTVHSDDGVVFSESIPLEALSSSSPPSPGGTLLYKTSLAPGFWDTIAQSSAASQYVIIQKVTQDSPSSSSPSTIFSAMYRFSYVNSPQDDDQEQDYSTRNMMSTAEPSMPKGDFFGSLLSMEPDHDFTDMMAFPKSQSNQFFDLGQYGMRPEDWSSCSSQSTDSVYASPVDCDKSMPFVMADEPLPVLMSSYPAIADVSTYVHV